MEDYLREGLSEAQISQLLTQLHNLGYGAGMDGLYWLPLPPEAHSPLQSEHLSTCGPYALALEVETNCLRLEFLVRARNSLCCDCIHPASPEVAAQMQASLEALLACAGIAASSD